MITPRHYFAPDGSVNCAPALVAAWNRDEANAIAADYALRAKSDAITL